MSENTGDKNNKNNKRDYLFIDDLIDAIIKLIDLRP